MRFVHQSCWLTVGFALLPACAPAQQSKNHISDSLANRETTELINRLTDISSEGIGFHSMALSSGFLPIEEEPRFQGGVLGSSKPEASPVAREIVRRGLAAMPDLLKHLDDSRQTKLIVGGKFFLDKWHSDEYDPRYHDPRKHPAGVNRGKQKDGPDKYTVRVGDVCYVLIGQIVNRNLRAVRYQPSSCLVINSPVETPALAQAVKADWNGLSSEQHERSLYEDALDLSIWRAPEAIRRLLFYYPATGKRLALRMLDRRFYDDEMVWEFFLKKLIPAKESQWDELLFDFRKVHGETNYVGLQRELAHASTKNHMLAESDKEVARKLLGQFFPWFEPNRPPFLDVVSFVQQKDLIDALGAFPSPDFEDALRDVFRRCRSARAQSLSAKIEQSDVAVACVRQLMRDPIRDELLKFLAQRLQEFKEYRKDSSNPDYFPALDQRIESIENLIKGQGTEHKRQNKP
jgi:hypothetical protein